MKRVLMSLALSLVLPAAVAAQVAPPPPPPPLPVPPTAPAPPPVPAAPRPPRVLTVPPVDLAIQDAMYALRDVHIDMDQIRDSIHQATVLAPIAMRDAWMHLDDFDFQTRNAPYLAEQDPNGSYSNGLQLISQKEWARAITLFDRTVAQKSPRADGALYWKAYAQYRINQTQEALTTIALLRKDHAQSRYLTDAKVLEADVRKTPPQDILDDEIKLLAISAMQHSDPERAIPLLENVLTATNTLRVKRQALFQLAQIGQPRARIVLLNYAKGAGVPDLQTTAIQYLAVNQDKRVSSEELRQIYESTTDVRVRSAVINAWQSSGNRGELVNLVSSTTTPVAVRTQAYNSLTGMLAPQDLWPLYEKEQDKNLRMQIVRAFGSMRALDQLNQVLRTEKDPEVRRTAIRSLGNLKTEQTGPILVEMYGRETDVETKKAIISGLAGQNNAEALIQITRKETSLELKRDLVQRLANMSEHSKVAADFLMELLKGSGGGN